MEIKVYLYDKDGLDTEIDFDAQVFEKIGKNQLLWVRVGERKKETVLHVLSVLQFENAPVKGILSDFERPKLEKFENFYRFFINSVNTQETGKIEKAALDFIVSRNIVVTIYDKEPEYFSEFANLDSGEKHIGGLDTESFVASLLDLHIVSYFRAIELIEKKVDKLDYRILTRDLGDDEFLNDIVHLRREVSKLRRLILPQRDVFYALARPDFQPIVESDSALHFQMLSDHFEQAVDSIESARDTVLSLFDLFTTKSSYNMNNLMKRLTFITLLVGGLGAIAGVWGMNFEVHYFKLGEYGFWLTLTGMLVFILATSILAKMKNWL